MPDSNRLFVDYTESTAPLMPFFPNTATGKEWIAQGQKLSAEGRNKLADLLAVQNARYGGSAETAGNIERLRGGASAVVTGQQVALFGGPLYTLLKAATAIARAREATEAGYDTVPVFWLASEDHDFEEIAHVELPDARESSGLKTVQIGSAPEPSVPVGGIRPGAPIERALAEAEELLGAGELMTLLREVYHPDAMLAESFGSLMARLFAPWGLIVIDAAGGEFHALGAKVLEAAIRDADALHAVLIERDGLLTDRGYQSQVKVAANSSLLFLLDEHTGTRLPLRRVRQSNGPEWKAGARRFSSDELRAILQASPERFSPNALLRPVFQD